MKKFIITTFIIFILAVIFFAYLSQFKSSISDNPSSIESISKNGKIKVDRYIYKGNSYHKMISRYLNKIGEINKKEYKVFIEFINTHIDKEHISAALLENGNLSILYLNEMNNNEEILENKIIELFKIKKLR